MDAADTDTTTALVPEELSRKMFEYSLQIERLIHYKKTKSHLPNLTDCEQRTVRNQAKTHELRNDKLYYLGGKKKVPREVITCEDRVCEILQHYHTSGQSGHCGVNTTLDLISSHYWWHNMKQDVQEFVNTCVTCKQSEKNQTDAAENQSSTSNKPPCNKRKAAEVSAVDKETSKRQENTQHTDGIEHFFKSLLPSVKRLDEMEIMQFRIDVEQLLLKYLYQASARKMAAPSSVTPQASSAAFSAAWCQNMDHPYGAK